jgi:hypothetical protein
VRSWLLIPAVVGFALLGSVVAFVGGACGPDVEAAYDGPYPSTAAQHALHNIVGRTLLAGPLGPEGQPLVVDEFAVRRNPVSGFGPVVVLWEPGRERGIDDAAAPQGAGGRWFVPVTMDGDAADLIQRATGATPVNFGGKMSDAYRATLGVEAR